MSAMAIYQQPSASVAGFGLESGADDRLLHLLPRASFVSRLWRPVPDGSRKTSCVQRMVESQAQESVARTEGLQYSRSADGAPLEPADAS